MTRNETISKLDELQPTDQMSQMKLSQKTIKN